MILLLSSLLLVELVAVIVVVVVFKVITSFFISVTFLTENLNFSIHCVKVKVCVQSFSQFVLENSSREDKHECPFARSSIQLTLILCEILRIGEPRKSDTRPADPCMWFAVKRILKGARVLLPLLPLSVRTASETGSDYHPIFFGQDRLMEELFCVCIQLLNKTWKEMRATQEDFDKVKKITKKITITC